MWLVALALVLVLLTWEDPVLRDLKSLYYRFIASLPDQYARIKHPALITGTYGNGEIGSNVNKGGEIFICMRNSVNDAFHVLLHELAHSMVKEYNHSDNFWHQFSDLKKIAVEGGFYTPVGRKEYCGKEISDS